MSKYIINQNKQDSASGENYEVHNEETCNHLPNLSNRIYLGYFSDCHEAVRKAKENHSSWSSDIDGCGHCCVPCHNE